MRDGVFAGWAVSAIGHGAVIAWLVLSPSALRDESVAVVFPEIVADFVAEHARQDLAQATPTPAPLIVAVAPPAALAPSPPAEVAQAPPIEPAATPAPPGPALPASLPADLAAVATPPAAVDPVQPAALAPLSEPAAQPLIAPSAAAALTPAALDAAPAVADPAPAAPPIAAVPPPLAVVDSGARASVIAPPADASGDLAPALPPRIAPAIIASEPRPSVVLPAPDAAIARVDLAGSEPAAPAPLAASPPPSHSAPVAPAVPPPAAIPPTAPVLIASAPAPAAVSLPLPQTAPAGDGASSSSFDPEEMITKAAERLACARVRAQFEPGSGAVALSGHVQSEADKARLTRDLAAIPGVERITGEALGIVGEPYCHVLAFLDRPGLKRSTDQRDNLGAVITLGTASAEAGVLALRAGMQLELSMAGPEFPSFVQVSYFTSDGRVYHLLPTERGDDHRLLANQPFKLGGVGGRGLPARIGPPFGLDIVLAVASSRPLFATRRPVAETARDYLAAMDAALSELRRTQANAQLEYAYFLIRTTP